MRKQEFPIDSALISRTMASGVLGFFNFFTLFSILVLGNCSGPPWHLLGFSRPPYLEH